MRRRWSYILLLFMPCVVFMVLNLTTYTPGKSIDPAPTTARQFYWTLDSIPDDAVVVGHTWGHPDLVIVYYSVNRGDRFDYICYDSLNSDLPSDRKYIEYQEGKGIRMPDDISWKVDGKVESIGVEEFANRLQILNPDREVYVTYVSNSGIPMEFGVVPVSRYSPGLNDVPESKVKHVD